MSLIQAGIYVWNMHTSYDFSFYLCIPLQAFVLPCQWYYKDFTSFYDVNFYLGGPIRFIFLVESFSDGEKCF